MLRAVFLSYLPTPARYEYLRYSLILLARYQSVSPVSNEIRPAFPEAHIIFKCANIYLKPVGTFCLEQPLLQKIFGVYNRSINHTLELFYNDALLGPCPK
jgi:hypothetical protein